MVSMVSLSPLWPSASVATSVTCTGRPAQGLAVKSLKLAPAAFFKCWSGSGRSTLSVSPDGSPGRRITALTLSTPYSSCAEYSSRSAARAVACGGVAKATVGGRSGTSLIGQEPSVLQPCSTARRLPDWIVASPLKLPESIRVIAVDFPSITSFGSAPPPCTCARTALPTGTATGAPPGCAGRNCGASPVYCGGVIQISSAVPAPAPPQY